MKKVLLTGASGFIGHQSIELLQNKNYEVHAITSRDIQKSKKKNNEVIWHKTNLLDPAAVSDLLREVKPTHLLHYAWYTEHRKYWTAAVNLDWVSATLHLAREFKKNNGLRIVGIGTCAEYDWKHGFCVEAVTPLKPSSLYGKSKKATHDVLQEFADLNNMSFAWGRIFFAFGPHEKKDRLIAYVINSLIRNEIAKCSHGQQIRDFMFVEDIADALVELLDTDMKGAVNIASGEPYSLKEIIIKVGEKLKKVDLIQFGDYPGKRDETPLLVGDTSRLENELQWRPDYNLDDAIEKTIEWWKNEFE